MESVGNEKKIQALFRELKLADELVAPEFISVWNRARATSQGSSRAFKLSFAMALIVIVIAIGSLGLWSQNWRRGQHSDANVATGLITPGATAGAIAHSTPDATSVSAPAPPAVPGPTQLVAIKSAVRVRAHRSEPKIAARRQRDVNEGNADFQEAVAISSWQSPTAMLMQSPADDMLTSLPELDRSLTELKTFLPNHPQ